MAVKIILSNFRIDPNNIPIEVENKYQSLSNSSKQKLEKHYGSARNFLAVLYHLWFVEKLEKNEIAAKFQVNPVNIHMQLYNFSWYYSHDYSENKLIFEDTFKKSQGVLLEAKSASQLLDINLHRKLQNALDNIQRINPKTYQHLGIKTKEEYIRLIYYLIYEKHFSPKMLIPLFNLKLGAINLRLKTLGFNASHEEGIAGKKERKSQNYETSIRSGKKTRAKEQLKNFSTGSKNQDYIRTQLANYIYDYFNSKRYEAIIGVSNTGILGSLEIDIPVIIYNIEERQIWRFAIEYNGDYFHSEKRDKSKRILAENKGWYYLEIIEQSSAGYSNKPQLLDPYVHELCKKIKEFVEANPM